jgi:hypothetical protein
MIFALFVQAIMGAHGQILCRHADGSERVENLLTSAACHESGANADVSDRYSVASADCTDQLLPPRAVDHRAATTESTRMNLTPIAAAPLPWAMLAFVEPKVSPPRLALDAISPSAHQHELLISAVVLLI